MLSGAPLPRLDLLLVGGMTVDSFSDGSTAPGGSVLHAARAASAAGHRVGAVVSAGQEPEAAAGLAELAGLAYLHAETVERSIGFEHREVGGDRQLRFLGSAGPFVAPSAAAVPAAVLYAPVADELGPELGGQLYPGVRRAAILQGWLRHLEAGEPVAPRLLAAIDPQQLHTLAAMDLLVASREDLAAEAEDPDDQLRRLRAAVGDRPTLVVTDAVAGVWLDRGGGGASSERWHMAVPRVVARVPTVGAGDMFAALLLAKGWPPDAGRSYLSRRATTAMMGVAEELAGRR